jgi:RNA polymerase sigma factor (sigma-70 family)
MNGSSVPPASDAVLVHGVLAGDEHAFRLLYRRHTPRLRQLLLRLLGEPRADAEDAVQETWMRAVAGLGTFRGDSAFGTWLVGIGVRTASELLRRRHRRRESGDPEDLAIPAPAARPAEGIDLERAVAALPDRHRMVLVLHDVEGFTHEEIAARLGVAAGTSKAWLFRARRAVRAMLGERTEASHDSTA